MHRPMIQAGSQAGPGSPRREAEGGFTLVLALFFLVISMGIVFAGTVELDRQRRSLDHDLYFRGQAFHFAQAGLVEATDWFRRQQSQPVTSFAPLRDELATPQILDTDDPGIGLVREYPIGRGVWGRFEVRQEVPGVPGLAEVEDVSKHRLVNGSGTVWKLVSRSYIYKLVDSGVPWNVEPNVQLATRAFEAEIRRLSFAPPAQAAILASRGQAVTVSAFGRIVGGDGTGVAYPTGSGSAHGAGQVGGSPPQAGLPGWDDSPEAIFGVSAAELRTMADLVIGNWSELPDPLPSNNLVFSDSDLWISEATPLNGTALLYVRGDVTFAPGSFSNFNGVLYVEGDLIMKAPSRISGMVIGRGNINVIGSGDWAEVIYDKGVVDSLLLEIGQYRRSTAVYRVDFRGALKR